MKHKNVLLASLLAASGFAGQSAYAVSNWVGTANYAAGPSAVGDEGVVGPFDTYDYAPGVVLLKDTSGGQQTSYDGWFQSYVTSHIESGNNGAIASAPGLNSNYDVTVAASFSETYNIGTNTFNLTGGTLQLHFDPVADHNFNTDTGFTNGGVILSGTIIAGTGGLFNVGGGRYVGFTDLTVRVDGYDTAVFSPDTIAAGSSIFTLRLGDPTDTTFLNNINRVMGHAYDSSSGDIKLAADGYMVMQVPEADTYAMMLAGLALVGFMARRRTWMSA